MIKTILILVLIVAPMVSLAQVYDNTSEARQAYNENRCVVYTCSSPETDLVEIEPAEEIVVTSSVDVAMFAPEVIDNSKEIKEMQDKIAKLQQIVTLLVKLMQLQK